VREKYDPQKLEDLLKVNKQLIVLNLGNMPVTDENMKTISKFSNLEKLILNNSLITEKGLTEIENIKSLRSLSLAGTQIGKNALPQLLKMASLNEVFLWNTGIKEADLDAWKNKGKEIIFNTGYVPDKGEVLALTAPVLKNESTVLAENERAELKHQIPGVVIRYTTDGSVPDSITSREYKEPIPVNGFTMVKARAVKDGWYSSPVIDFALFKKGIMPQKAELETIPHERHKGEGGITLIDGKKGAPKIFTDAAWLGFKEQPFAAVFSFEKQQTISSISISYNMNVPSYIMPPTEVEVWGGDTKDKLKLLKKIIPPQTTKEEMNVVRNEAVKIEIPPSAFRYYKIMAKNITKLPSWHPGKGEKGWVFIDEVFFN